RLTAGSHDSAGAPPNATTGLAKDCFGEPAAGNTADARAASVDQRRACLPGPVTAKHAVKADELLFGSVAVAVTNWPSGRSTVKSAVKLPRPSSLVSTLMVPK